MTAEIAIINKNAVALAADSAVTLRDPNTSKIYNTANKLFMLSKFEPVGVMVYGAAEFMDVPLETIIKIYRSKLSTRSFSKLNDYAHDFLEFLASDRLLFPPEKQRATFESIASRLYWRLRYEIDEQVKSEITSAGLKDADIERIATAKIDEFFDRWLAVDYLSSCDSNFEQSIGDTYADSITKVIETVFEKLPIETSLEKLRKLAVFRISRNHWPESCGLVFAGFGELDVLPCVKSFIVEAVIGNKVRFNPTPNLSNDMNEKPIASIMPFAQAEIVYRFIQGIDPEYKKEVRKYLRALLTKEYPEKLIDKFQTGLSEEDKRNALAELIKTGRAIVDDFDREWETLEWEKFVGPVLDIVADLPKEDLAAMAESLVNLTSFKRRISREAETVGGPIDVAVISKGDGFIWIKRKHYFSKELNPNFFANYYRERGKST